MKHPKTGPKSWPRTIRVGSVGVKVYKVDHPTNRTGKTYVVAWTTPAGRMRRKFADEDDAIAEARLRAGQINAGQIEAAGMSKPDRDELHAARKLAEGVPLLAAMQEWARARELTEGNVIPAAKAWAARNSTKRDRIKVSVVVDRYLAAKTKAGIQVAKNHGHIFADLKRDLGDQFIDAVTARQLDQWFARWEHPGTRNTFRTHTVALWRWAQKQNYLNREIKTEAEHTERVAEGDMEIGTISAETYGNLLEHFRAKHPEYLAPLVLCGFAGMRRSEVHTQKWEDINLAAGHLRVTKGKKGTPSRRLVPLCAAAVEWLMLTPDRTGPLCTNLAVDRIRHIARDAKFEIPENAFRHSFISHRVAATGNIAETSLVAGNSPDIIRKHYLELVTKAEGEAWFAIVPRAKGKAEVIEMKGTA